MKALTSTKNFFVNTFGLLTSIYFMIRNTQKSRVFYGYWHYHFAKKYADKRCKAYPTNLNQRGKTQGIFAAGPETLIVISQLELRLIKKRNLINHPKWYKKIFKKEAYYIVNR